MNSDHQSISISKFCNISVIIILFCFKILWKCDFLDLFVYHLDFFCFLFFFLYAIFSRGHATTPCRVGWLVRWSVGPSITFLNCEWFLAFPLLSNRPRLSCRVYLFIWLYKFIWMSVCPVGLPFCFSSCLSARLSS